MSIAFQADAERWYRDNLISELVARKRDDDEKSRSDVIGVRETRAPAAAAARAGKCTQTKPEVIIGARYGANLLFK